MAPQPQLVNPESWEQKEVQIRLERAEEFAKLTPQEQQKTLDQEKIKFHQEQTKARENLGYKKFESTHPDLARTKEEARQKADELAKFEKNLDQKNKKEGLKEKPEDLDLKRFKEILTAAEENITKRKSFEFQSIDLDNKGQRVTHQAFMTKLLDHSQKNEDLTAGQIWQRIEQKAALPTQISLQIEVDMGEDKGNHLGLTNLRLEVSLASLLDGHFLEKLTNFTNMVFFAAELHHRQGQAEQKKPLPPEPDKNAAAKVDQTTVQAAAPFGLTSLVTNGSILPSIGAFQAGQTTAAAFSFNQGAVWGTFDTQKVPANPRELQEAYDKLTADK